MANTGCTLEAVALLNKNDSGPAEACRSRGILRPWQIIVPRGDELRVALGHVSRRRLVLNEWSPSSSRQ